MLSVTYLVYVRGVAASLRFEPNWWYNLAMDQIYVYLLYIFCIPMLLPWFWEELCSRFMKELNSRLFRLGSVHQRSALD